MFEVIINIKLTNDQTDDFRYNIVKKFAIQERNFQYKSGRNATHATFIIDASSMEDALTVRESYSIFGTVEIREKTTATLVPAFSWECPQCGCEQVALQRGYIETIAHQPVEYVFCGNCDWSGSAIVLSDALNQGIETYEM